MDPKDRKAAVSLYKERKVEAGIFRIDCAASGQVWIGSAPDLSTIWNRHAFALRLGNHRCKSLQAAWQVHGEGEIAFAPLECFDEKEATQTRDRWMQSRLAHWRDALGAETV